MGIRTKTDWRYDDEVRPDDLNRIEGNTRQLEENKVEQEEHNVLKTRVDNLLSLPHGSTTGDAELSDLRVGANGEIYKTAGEATREQFKKASSKIGELNGDLDELCGNYYTNKLIVSECTEGGYIGSDGNLVVSNYWESSYIKVKPNDTIRVIHDGVSYNAHGNIIAIYDSNKTFLKTIYGKIPFVCPSNIDYSYIRLPLPVEFVIENTMITVNDSVEYDSFFKHMDDLYTEFKKVYKYVDDGVQDLDVKKIGYAKSINLFNKETTIDGYYVKNDGTLIKDSSFYTSDYIELEIGKKYYVRSDYIQSLPLYDSEKNLVSDISNSKNGYFEVSNPKYKYIRFYGYIRNKDTDMFCVGSYPDEYIPYSNNIITDEKLEYLASNKDKIKSLIDTKINSKWYGKKCLQLGDSITWYDGHSNPKGEDVKGYAGYLRDIGMTVNNKGVSGACIAYTPERYTDVCTTIDSITDLETYDLVTIAGGVNDYQTDPVEIGTLANDNFDKTKFIQAYQYIIEKILSINPTVQIVIFTPLKCFNMTTENTKGLLLSDYVDAVREVAEYYSIPIFDQYANCGFNKKTSSTYTIDNLHPNNLGYKMICETKLLPFLEII